MVLIVIDSNGEWTFHPTRRGVSLSLYEWKELTKDHTFIWRQRARTEDNG